MEVTQYPASKFENWKEKTGELKIKPNTVDKALYKAVTLLVLILRKVDLKAKRKRDV